MPGHLVYTAGSCSIDGITACMASCTNCPSVPQSEIDYVIIWMTDHVQSRRMGEEDQHVLPEEERRIVVSIC